MKKKMVLRLLSLAMVASMTGTMLPSNLQLVSAEESVATEEKTEKQKRQQYWKMESMMLGLWKTKLAKTQYVQ